MMFSVQSNLSQVVGNLLSKVKTAQQTDAALKKAVAAVGTESHNRIFVRGENSDGTAIGVHRDGSKVYLTDTGQMRAAYSFGSSTIGFTDAENAQKAAWNESRYGVIFSLTASELALFDTAYLAALKVIFS